MYTTIKYATLQLHSGNETDHNTISKTIAVYEKDFFIFSNEDLLKQNLTKEIKKTILKNSKKVKNNRDILPPFVWHLN